MEACQRLEDQAMFSLTLYPAKDTHVDDESITRWLRLVVG